jgi:hypothetical protein
MDMPNCGTAVVSLAPGQLLAVLARSSAAGRIMLLWQSGAHRVLLVSPVRPAVLYRWLCLWRLPHSAAWPSVAHKRVAQQAQPRQARPQQDSSDGSCWRLRRCSCQLSPLRSHGQHSTRHWLGIGGSQIRSRPSGGLRALAGSLHGHQ